MNVLGIDAGASSTKWAVLGAQGLLAQGRAPALSGHLFLDSQRQLALHSLAELHEQTKSFGPQAITGGVTGLDSRTPEADWMAQELSRLYSVSLKKIKIFNDMDLAYRANFSLGEGILLYAGTGSVAYHLDAGGQVIRAGGHGYLIGDEGGGFWIGKTALRQLMYWHDAAIPTLHRPLAQQLYAAIGGSEWKQIREYVYGQGRQAVAKLALAVGKAAHEGDSQAQEILKQAGYALADLAQTLRMRTGNLPVVLCGGALHASEGIAEGAKEKLELEVRTTPFAEAAAQMALELFNE